MRRILVYNSTYFKIVLDYYKYCLETYIDVKKFTLISLLFFLASCTKNFDREKIIAVDPPITAKIEGKHAIFISNKIFNHIKEIRSEDCESWALKLDFDQPLRTSIESLIKKMYIDYNILEKKLLKSEIEEKGFVSQISFLDFQGKSEFTTERNTGKYKISLYIKIKVENSSKNIFNEISSNMNWEKNIFLNCNLQQGAVKSSQIALNNFIKEIHEKTYESIFKITK